MSKLNNPNLLNKSDAKIEHKTLGLTRRQQGGLLLAGISLFSTLSGAGCSAKSADNQPQKSNVKIEAEKKVELSASEKGYAEYLKTLSPEQVAVREALNPDALAKMSESELTDVFTIKADEVTIDGKIDKNLYAEAFTARFQAMGNSGLSEIEYAKWGGLDKFGIDDMAIVVNKYNEIQSMALFGYVGGSEMNEIALKRGSGVSDIIKSGLKPQPKEQYRLRVSVRPDSISQFIENDNGTYDIRFSGYMSDNWDKQSMELQTGLSIEPTDGFITWDINGLHVTESGSVLPNSEITTN